ncbi:hypothetical protein ACFWR6_07160 [Streptomyces griseus]|uniref:hypothetical protein n=1 Tax=Streptomyces griseus TaxID=1911 RepID=UPI003666AAAE
MDPLARFLLGAACGTLAAGITYTITQEPQWWWAVGLIVACLVWFRELILELLP